MPLQPPNALSRSCTQHTAVFPPSSSSRRRRVHAVRRPAEEAKSISVMEAEDSPRTSGCGASAIYSNVFRRGFWHRRSSSAGAIPRISTDGDVKHPRSPNNGRRRTASALSDERALAGPANLPASPAAAKYALVPRPPGSSNLHRASPRRPSESTVRALPPPAAAPPSNGIAADLDSMVYDHQRAKGSSTLVRASSSNLMVLGNLGNLRGNIGGNMNRSPSRNVLDYLPKTAKELSMEANASKKTAREPNVETNARNSTTGQGMGNIVRNMNNKELTVAAPGTPPELCRALSRRLDPEELKETGNEEYKKGRFAEALALYDRAIVLDPRKASYRSNKAAALMALGRLFEAVKECKEAIRMDPAYYRAHHRLASLYLRLGEADKAIHHFKLARKEASSSDVSRAQEVQTHLAKSNEARKLKDYLTMLKESQSAASSGADSSLQVFALQAEALLKLLRHEEADSVLSGAPKYDVNESTKFYGAVGNAYFLMICAQVDLAAGRFQDAVATAQIAAQLEPGNREIAVVVRRTKAVASARSRGNDLFKAARFAEACVAYGEGLDHDAHNAILLSNRAACRSKLGHHEKAIEDCNTALIVRPSYSKARLRRADCNAKLERWEASIKDYGVLIQELPGDEEVSKGLSAAQAQLMKKQGEHVEDSVQS